MDKYFSFDPNGIHSNLLFHETEEQAKARCIEAIADSSDNAAITDIYGDNDDDICFGEIKGRANFITITEDSEERQVLRLVEPGDDEQAYQQELTMDALKAELTEAGIDVEAFLKRFSGTVIKGCQRKGWEPIELPPAWVENHNKEMNALQGKTN